MAYRKPQRKEINPRSLRKHSDLVMHNQVASGVVGSRERTDTGYTISGTICSSFETFTEVFLPHTASSTQVHPKKHRSYRVLSGTGIIVVNDKVTKLFGGLTVTVQPEESFRVVTTGEEPLELVVTQSPKYASRLKAVDNETVGPEHIGELRSITAEDAEAAGVKPRLRGSKAKEQGALLPSQQKKGADNTSPGDRPLSPVNVSPAKVVDGELVG